MVAVASGTGEVSDEALLAAAARGDRGSLAALYERHAGWLFVRLSRRCGDPELVDTAVQDTFISVWRSASRYQPTGEVGAWIWSIGIRRLVDGMRRRPPPVPVEVDAGAAAGLGMAAPSDAALCEALGASDVGTAFRLLSPELQAVLEATALDGLTTKEASVLLGIPQGTVKTRLARARAQLRSRLT
jgi:RNA polymerase sigma-70 factor (ECF subfamily)